MNDKKRFWSKVGKGEPGECWEWQAYRNEDGYGQFGYNGRVELAHRVSLKIAGGVVGDAYVLHHCDNPACVNPGHLYLGDQSDNMQDREERSDYEHPRGEEHPRSSLSDDDVAVIKWQLENTDMIQKEIAEDHGVSREAIGEISRGATWGHVEAAEEVDA
jgi:hypothetical protein